PRPIPQAARDFTEEEIQELLKAGLITRVFDSPWASPIHLVPKRGSKKWRMCIDFRAVNEVTEPFAGTIPLIDELLASIKGKSILSTFDLTSAYHQCPIAEEDRIKTTFATPMGNFMFVRVPYGLKNAVQYYCQAVAGIMRPIAVNQPDALIAAYLDDVIVGSATFDRHCELLEDFLNICVANRCKISLEKSHVGCKEVSYLGYRVNSKYYT
ncbi:MAG: reverse transcriptase family protein, partial [Gemmatimonadota bacterium]